MGRQYSNAKLQGDFTVTHELYKEIACAATCTDDAETAAWLQVRLRHDRPLEAACCEAWWTAAGEEARGAMGCKLGWTEPAVTPGFYDAIVRDFAALQARASSLLDFVG